MSAASNLQAGTIDTCGYIVNGRHDSTLIEWSDGDRAYLAGLPAWKQGGQVLGAVPHGGTDAEAAQQGVIALETRVNSLQDLDWEWPAPRVHAVPAQPTGAEE